MKYFGGGGATASAGQLVGPTNSDQLRPRHSQLPLRSAPHAPKHSTPGTSFYWAPRRDWPRLTRAPPKGSSAPPQERPQVPPGTNAKRRGGARNRGRGSQETQSPRRRGTCDMECAQPEAMSRVPVTWQPASRHTLQTPDHQGSAPDVARKLPRAQLQAHSRWGLSALAWLGLASAAFCRASAWAARPGPFHRRRRTIDADPMRR
ncbi:hypothetical protein BGZ61DRAFT_572247 [Ilyonectria robusta]|uniref:uncharacterized protein n=1 Tax=Ilyonectria robusta TaxID=1079257 RepID=UPI001E8E66B0|nr:uncharacterized protein BGZ61DRAFT_572247 [Ilyonectria robusta]KAH8722024.1 hypothetical protein BGZ61DRAFT_572247 [Ilyonectria robusta]